MKKLLSVLSGQIQYPPPLWLMRQAGRYLPEYRQTRRTAGSFLDLCYNSDLATEVTLQPIHRYGFDAAIIFSDILVVPHALGQNLRFAEGEGPRLDPIKTISQLAPYDKNQFLNHLKPTLTALANLREQLPSPITLIGFCGAPWTVASYMVAGRGTPDLAPIRQMAQDNKDDLQQIIDQIVQASIDYLIAQIDAGAEVLQIFESWAEVLKGYDFDKWSLDPISRIVAAVTSYDPTIPIIVFPRKSGDGYIKVARLPGVKAVSVDPDIDLKWAADTIQPLCAVQGNIDPKALISGPEAIDFSLNQLHNTLAKGPWIANLGHGITPQTPLDHVSYLVKRVREIGPG